MTTTADRLLEKYGERMTVRELSEVLRLAVKTIQERRSMLAVPDAGGQSVPPGRVDGKRVFFRTVDVAEHLDRFHARGAIR